MADNNNQDTKESSADNEPIVGEADMKMPEGAYSEPEEKTSSMLGLILAVLIVVLILILGGLYLWGTTLNNQAPVPEPAERPTAEENNEPESTTAEADVQTLETVSTSDEIEAIEADLESTDFAELDAELNAIEAELDAALE